MVNTDSPLRVSPVSPARECVSESVVGVSPAGAVLCAAAVKCVEDINTDELQLQSGISIDGIVLRYGLEIVEAGQPFLHQFRDTFRTWEFDDDLTSVQTDGVR